MTFSALRIAALFLLSIPEVCAAASPAGPNLLNAADADQPDAVDADLPNAAAVGLFCGGIVKHETGTFSRIIYKNLEITVDAGNNINVADKGVLLGQIKSVDYSTFGQCLYATLAAMRQYAK
jgi:hypothetical protein